MNYARNASNIGATLRASHMLVFARKRIYDKHLPSADTEDAIVCYGLHIEYMLGME